METDEFGRLFADFVRSALVAESLKEPPGATPPDRHASPGPGPRAWLAQQAVFRERMT